MLYASMCNPVHSTSAKCVNRRVSGPAGYVPRTSRKSKELPELGRCGAAQDDVEERSRPPPPPPPPPPCALLAALALSVALAASASATATASASASPLQVHDIVVVVLSQESAYHINQSKHLRADIQQQAISLSQEVPIVHLAHEDFPHPGAWTVLPILERLYFLHGENSSWVFFCEGHTKLNITLILDLFMKYDANKEIWIGHAIYDREATIIHHFEFKETSENLKYPNFASGFAMSTKLLKRLSKGITNSKDFTDFSIDPSHELASFIWDNGQGPRLTHVPQLCLRKQENCASYPLIFKPCGDPVNRKLTYFAVKTCEKFHHDRIPVVKKTWAKYAVNIGYYSEAADDAIPTIDLGIPNTERGHCGKTFAILEHIASHLKTNPEIKWAIIVDDDTILSVARLQQLLSCYDPDSMIAIGERYGYNVQDSEQGYNYITGGGGMVLSANLIHAVVRSEHCKCPSLSTPDDMFLGICLATLRVPVIHSPLFHQARPSDYAPEYLKSQVPVSFHKHWMIDPLRVYNKWFAEADKQFEDVIHSAKHIEL